MGQTKHEKSFTDYDKGYEQNLIGLKGIIYFAVGLVALIVITFGLMFALQNVMEQQAAESKASKNPLAFSDNERLPPEPRLQAAPGFRVESANGPINLELKAPQSEYWELRSQWETLWQNGQKDAKTGTVITMPITQAKTAYLEQIGKTANGAAAPAINADLLNKSREIVSDSSSGRMANEKRR